MTIQTVGIIGAGTMGNGIAQACAVSGINVVMVDISDAAVQKGIATVAGSLDRLIKKEKITAADKDAALARIKGSTRYEDLQTAQLVIEAATENYELKLKILKQADALLAPEVIIASNTSYLDIFPLMPAARQRRTLIAHWYTPPYLVDLVDIVGGPETDPACIETVRAICAAMGKQPIVMRKFVPGYIANRLQSAIGLEVQQLLDDGVATPEEIDAAIIHGIALRLPILGVLAKADFTGLPMMQHALRNKMYAPPPVRGRSESLDRLIAEGKTGVMSGAGFYDWGGKDPAALFEERDRRLLALRKALREIGTMAGLERDA